jgi:hypothetical protein
LLNGGFKYHTSRTSYKKSRGIIVKDLLRVDNIHKGLDEIDLIDVEQFTLTIVDWNRNLELIEFVWDGEKKHIKKLPQEPHIWSSSTLYDESVKQLRFNWFTDWQKNNNYSQKSILGFHHNAGVGDFNIDVCMNRGVGGTVSITSIKKENNDVLISYKDVLNSNEETKILEYKS